MEQAKYNSRDEIFQIFLDDLSAPTAPSKPKDIRRSIRTAVEDYSELAGIHPTDMDKEQLIKLVSILMDEAHIEDLSDMLYWRKESRLDQMEERNGEL